MTYRIAYEDCEEKFRELIEKHIVFNCKCIMDYAKEGEIGMVLSHRGAVTGLKMLLKELDGEVEY